MVKELEVLNGAAEYQKVDGDNVAKFSVLAEEFEQFDAKLESLWQSVKMKRVQATLDV